MTTGTSSESTSNNRSRTAPRLFFDGVLSGDTLLVDRREANYLGNVLRLKPGSDIVVFNGRGDERVATIKSLARHMPELSLGEWLDPLAAGDLELILVQALLKTDAMDTVVQKATELGVRSIHAVKTDFSVVKLGAERAPKRIAHWARIAQSACEQSGRHAPPEIQVHDSLRACLDALPAAATRVAFHRGIERRLTALEPSSSTICLLIGPEGGFSPSDLQMLERSRVDLAGLGTRVLRAETAAIAACASAQLLWGDIG